MPYIKEETIKRKLEFATDILTDVQKTLNFDAEDEYEGLKRKYIVLKADTGELVENCFVLRPDKDPAARAALRAYAEATENKQLANDITNWVGKED